MALALPLLMLNNLLHQVQCPVVIDLHHDFLIVVGVQRACQICHLDQSFHCVGVATVLLLLGLLKFISAGTALQVSTQNDNALGTLDCDLIEFLGREGIALPDNKSHPVPQTMAANVDPFADRIHSYSLL